MLYYKYIFECYVFCFANFALDHITIVFSVFVLQVLALQTLEDLFVGLGTDRFMKHLPIKTVIVKKRKHSLKC